jgi:hypothetical protein
MLSKFPLLNRLNKPTEQTKMSEVTTDSKPKRVRAKKALPPYNTYHPFTDHYPYAPARDDRRFIGQTLAYHVSDTVDKKGYRLIHLRCIPAGIEVSRPSRAKWMTDTMASTLLSHLQALISMPAIEKGEIPEHVEKIIKTAHAANPASKAASTREQVKTTYETVRDEKLADQPKRQPAEIKTQVAFGDITSRLVAEAETRKQILQTQAAINIGIGVVLTALNQTEIRITAEAISKFVAIYQINQIENPDGSYTLQLVKR